MRCEVTPFPALMCKVGETEVYTGRALRESLGEYLDALAGGGRVLVTWDGEGGNEAKRTTEALRGFGLRVTEKPDTDVCEAEENCLVVLGVGAERAHTGMAGSGYRLCWRRGLFVPGRPRYAACSLLC